MWIHALHHSIYLSNSKVRSRHASASEEKLFLTLLLTQGVVSFRDAVAAGFELPHHSEDIPILFRFTAVVTSNFCSTGAERQKLRINWLITFFVYCLKDCNLWYYEVTLIKSQLKWFWGSLWKWGDRWGGATWEYGNKYFKFFMYIVHSISISLLVIKELPRVWQYNCRD